MVKKFKEMIEKVNTHNRTLDETIISDCLVKTLFAVLI